MMVSLNSHFYKNMDEKVGVSENKSAVLLLNPEILIQKLI